MNAVMLARRVPAAVSAFAQATSRSIVLSTLTAVVCGDCVAALPFDATCPADGRWFGAFEDQTGVKHWSVIDLQRNPDGSWHAEVVVFSPPNLFVDTDAFGVTSDGRSMNLEVQWGDVCTRFAGAAAPDGQSMVGDVSIKQAKNQVADRKMEWRGTRTLRPSQWRNPLVFAGRMRRAEGGEDEVAFAFIPPEESGTWAVEINIPTQSTSWLPLINLHFDAVPGRASAIIPGSIAYEFFCNFNPQGPVLPLTLRLGKQAGRFQFDRIEAADARWGRPQTPIAPYPYNVHALPIAHPAGHTLGCTLTTPKGPGPFPTAVLISGSERDDRDYASEGHRPFAVLADALSRRGFAVARFDDRGVAGSSGTLDLDDTTLLDTASDVLAVVNRLKTLPQLDSRRVTLLGHSEGGTVAPIVANLSRDIRCVALLAGWTSPGHTMITLQSMMEWTSAGIPEDIASAQGKRLHDLVLQMTVGETLENAKATYADIYRELIKAGARDPGQKEFEHRVHERMAELMTPRKRFWLTYDPRSTLTALRCPILLVHGSKDRIVWHDQELPEATRAVQQTGGDITVRLYDNLDHSLRPVVDTDDAGDLSVVTIDSTMIDDLIVWLMEKMGQADQKE